jgi:hypothetical protein
MAATSLPAEQSGNPGSFIHVRSDESLMPSRSAARFCVVTD